jgi:hypothetical protein
MAYSSPAAEPDGLASGGGPSCPAASRSGPNEANPMTWHCCGPAGPGDGSATRMPAQDRVIRLSVYALTLAGPVAPASAAAGIRPS